MATAKAEKSDIPSNLAALSAGLDLEACMRVSLRVAAHKIRYRGTLAFPKPEAVGLVVK